MSKRIAAHIHNLQDMPWRVGAGAALSDSTQCERELRESIERGVADSDAGRVISVEELMNELGIHA
jgi:predicted transcriptional regulator